MFGKVLISALCISLARVQADDIVQTAVGTESLSTLVTALTSADLVGALSEGSESNLTVFAPTNAAFNDLDLGVVTTLLLPVNKDLLTTVLTYHVATGVALAESLSLNQEVPTLQGENVTVTQLTPTVMLNSAATVSSPDVMASNGVVHIIDAVLIPTAFAESFPNKNIVQTANGTSVLSTLTAAVVAADLGTALSGSNLTVFAPTNAAFAALGETLDKLLLPVNLHILASILQYHVSATPINSLQLGDSVETLNGTLNFSVTSLAANTTDILCAGGSVVHIIDSVLVPSWFSADLLMEDDSTDAADGAVNTDAASLPYGAPMCRVLALLFAMWTMFH